MQGVCSGHGPDTAHHSLSLEVTAYRLMRIGEQYVARVVSSKTCSACAKKKRHVERAAAAAPAAASAAEAAPSAAAAAARATKPRAAARSAEAGAMEAVLSPPRAHGTAARSASGRCSLEAPGILRGDGGGGAEAAAAVAAANAATAAARAAAALALDAAAAAARPRAPAAMARTSVEELITREGLKSFLVQFRGAFEAVVGMGGDAAMRKKCTPITGKQLALFVTTRSALAGGMVDDSTKVTPRGLAGQHAPRAHLTPLPCAAPARSGAA